MRAKDGVKPRRPRLTGARLRHLLDGSRQSGGEGNLFLRRFVAVPQERLVGYGRVLLAITGLVAIYVDPSQPTRHEVASYAVLVAYVLFAVGFLAFAFARPISSPMQLAIHFVDLGIISLLLLTTEGPTSPFFVFFSFALLAATLRWEWRGALWTGGFLVMLLLVLAVYPAFPSAQDEQDLDRLIIRISYLFVASALFAYFGAFRALTRHRLENLAAWPITTSEPNKEPPLREALARAAKIVGARRLAVVWRRQGERRAFYADWRNGTFHSGEIPLESVPFDAPRAAAGVVGPAEIPDTFPLDNLWQSAPHTSFRTERCGGLLLVVATRSNQHDEAQLREIIATRIGYDLELHAAQVELQTAAATHERMALARDLHDGVLQGLTAVRLQLKLGDDETGEKRKVRYQTIANILESEQRRLREFVEGARPRASALQSTIRAGEAVQSMAERLAGQWIAEISAEAFPSDLPITRKMKHQVDKIFAEAVSNAVRHGHATRVELALHRTDAGIRLEILNNGEPMSRTLGFHSMDELCERGVGPASLIHRVSEAGGNLTLLSREAESRLTIELPDA